ncbi:thiamine pyrophosphate-binding protein [Sulfitobacter mediterraneus]|uniref:thiamine pyrophosphate-binding protein n=1 Tax=Sulfitobacter mediterraneus TaxID=83219 RepID=UPI001931D270|nr:thiamine pyrophosphate-binding protein [Sulfitobacter mediterraneus]MBM1633133.1 thiamine pyrophosphate-binding protein [Sulfitobacter mediterraneus]MBM1640733.1 thiamine pyrophosphate-binding protein [Sulfitobacter mediterraneus]MBM1644998.1 thiamine pyrophosphate-binding protein [Sulfitobacter mediterraneus]MBM1648853.1 thiamine pyrophosphate-binding protein [Sulfitobacter mediterraneus]MBM1652874.1 thiamine pyrophosphate-binding protein [Sulfitobacter mediterraneus]
MTDAPSPLHGGALLTQCLVAQGVERVFCIPGESFLAALDGLYDADIDVVVARQEGGAAMMAEATGKLTGKPGIAFVTRGPGATNASAGVHIAFQDSTPMILFVGQVASDQRDREAFQEVDYRAMFGPLAKWVAEIDRADRIPEYISHAFHIAQSGRPGPVVLALPEDMLSGVAEGVPVPAATLPSGKAADTDLRGVVEKLATAKRPLIIAGGASWDAEAAEALGTFAKQMGLPVGASFRCQDFLDNRHPNYVGDVGIGINPDLAKRVQEADLILALGARLGEMTTSGYTLLTPPVSHQELIHIHADPSEIGRVYYPTLAVVAQPGPVIKQLRDMSISREGGAWLTDARAAYEQWQEPQETPGALKMEQVISHLNTALSDDAILTNGAGNYSAWLHRYYRYRGWRTQLAPTSGSMGYGLPAAIAAKLHHPERDVICLAGDGCFQMVSQEFGTACEQGAAVITLVSDNGMYGTIRMHQQRHYPGRPSGTMMKNPDFAALAKAYGGFGATVTTTEAFGPALTAARESGLPAILHLKLDPAALSPKMRLEGH